MTDLEYVLRRIVQLLEALVAKIPPAGPPPEWPAKPRPDPPGPPA